MFLNNCKSNSTFLPQTTKWFRYILTWQQLIFKNFIIFFFSQENNAKETNKRMNIFFILTQFSFLQIKEFSLYNKIPINWYFITNNHSCIYCFKVTTTVDIPSGTLNPKEMAIGCRISIFLFN